MFEQARARQGDAEQAETGLLLLPQGVLHFPGSRPYNSVSASSFYFLFSETGVSSGEDFILFSFPRLVRTTTRRSR